MAWTDPRTWVTGELVTASLLNTHLRDNLNFLKDRPAAVSSINEGSDYTTTSATFVDVDATNGKFQQTLTTEGGDVLVMPNVNVGHSSSTARVWFDIAVDGTRWGSSGNDGLGGFRFGSDENAPGQAWQPVIRITGLAPGSHTFKLQWKTNTGTATLYAGAGTTDGDVIPQFNVMETGDHDA